MNSNYLISFYGITLTLCVVCATLPNSFAQIELGEGILSCDYVEFCSNPVEIVRSSSESSSILISSDNISESIQSAPKNTTQLAHGISELIPDVTSNISLIMTPDSPNNLGVLEETEQAANETIGLLSNSTLKNFSINNGGSERDVVVTDGNLTSDGVNQSNNFSTPISTSTNVSLSHINSENTFKLENEQSIWKNFSSPNGYSLSYPPDWNLTTHENEVYIESNELDSDIYPKMTISIRNLDPSKLNNSILLAEILPIDNVPSGVAKILLNNTKTISNIGLKYYVDSDYIVVEPTQTEKYVIDGKSASAFTVHKLGNNYENEHITVNNDGKIFSLEVNYSYYPSSANDTDQINQIKENILESIRWTHDRNAISKESKTNELERIESSEAAVLENNNETTTENSEIKKTITLSDSSLNITSSTDFFDGDRFKIVGEVTNTGSADREWVKIVATFYNHENIIIGTDFTHTDPSEISVDSSAPFMLIIDSGDVSNISAIKSYKLHLSSETSQPTSVNGEGVIVTNDDTTTLDDSVLQIVANTTQDLDSDEFVINAKLREQGFGNMSNSYSLENFEIGVGSNSALCPGNNCEFSLENGNLWSFNAGEYSLSGVLMISTLGEDGKRSKFMEIYSPLNVEEVLEKDGVTSESLGGKFNLGSSTSVVSSPTISYSITNGTLITNGDGATLNFLGKEI